MEDLDNRIEAAERDIVSAENELRLARAESEARALRGQYAFRLLVYKAPSLRFKAENDLLDELIAERADSPNPADQAATSCLKQLREDLDPPPAADEYRRFVALNDPNDLLGYSIPKKLAEPYAALFSNVSLRLSTQFFGLAANPLVAHSGHERNPLALQLMTCGTVENDKKRGTRYVPRRCHPTAEPVLTDSESQLQTAALRGE